MAPGTKPKKTNPPANGEKCGFDNWGWKCLKDKPFCDDGGTCVKDPCGEHKLRDFKTPDLRIMVEHT